MPIYEYRCEKGHTFEVLQKMTDDPVTTCEVCGKPVQRVFHPVAVHFKGKGFYNTDYGTKRRNRELRESAESGADKHDAKQADKKADSTSSSSDSSSSTASDSKPAKESKKADKKPAAKK
jgi:putative FmdB family regulatory protein